MKKITQKILAGILTLAMALGCFGGMGTLEVRAAASITSVTADKTLVPREGETKVEITVKGSGLSSTSLRFGRFRNGRDDCADSPKGIWNLGAASSSGGSNTQKKFTVTLPQAIEGQESWVIGVATATLSMAQVNQLPNEQFVTIQIGEEPVTKDDLKAAIDEARKEREDSYTSESWSEFADAIAGAETIYEKEDATEEQYREALKALEAAKSNLVLIPEKEKYKILKINVLDESTNKPLDLDDVKKLKFRLEHNTNREDRHDVTVDSEGSITINADTLGTMATDDNYILILADGSGYKCIKNIAIRFAEGEKTKKLCIKTILYGLQPVSVKATTEMDLHLRGTKIDGVSTDTTLIKNKGQVEVSVNGTGVPEELYYSLSYTKAAGADAISYGYNNGKMTPITATGSDDTSKTITVTLPEKPEDAYAWKINVAASKTDTITYSTGLIRVVEEATKEELEEAIDVFSGKVASEYTEETWNPYKLAIEEGKKVVAKQDATALEYGVALADIKAAEDELLLKAATSNKTLLIKAEDEEGNPASKIMFEIKNGFKSLYFPETDEDGRATYTMNGTETNSTGNTILLMDNAKYECDIPITVDFYVMSTGSDYKRYIKKFVVDGKKIQPEEEAVIVVKRKPEIFKAVSSVDTADEDGESATIALTGVKLQETVYYDLYGTDRKGKKTYAAEKQEVQTAGTGNTERTFEVEVPAISEYPEIISWTVVAYPTKDSTSGASVKINTTNDPVTEETMEKLNAAVKDAARLKEADYTPASWKAYQEAVQAAKAVLGNEKSTETEYRNALKVLTDAKAALVAKSGGTIQEYKVTKIQIAGASRKIAAGKKIQLTASVLPSNASNKAVKWTTSNKKYATVDSKGKVSVKKAGAGKSVTITATAADGSGVKATYKIKIQKDAVKSITLKAKKTVKAGKTLKVKATVKTTGKKANKTLKWTSSNTKYATVSSKGVVKAKKAGKGRKVKITASATDGSGKKKTVTVKIK